MLFTLRIYAGQTPFEFRSQCPVEVLDALNDAAASFGLKICNRRVVKDLVKLKDGAIDMIDEARFTIEKEDK